jgi:hypothetical protein
MDQGQTDPACQWSSKAKQSVQSEMEAQVAPCTDRAPTPPDKTAVPPQRQFLVPPSPASAPSPSRIGCLLCGQVYQNNRFEMNCCGKATCLKCIAIWFFHYGKKCPFCNRLKREEDQDIELMITQLMANPVLLNQVSAKCPSRRVHTTPLLPQPANNGSSIVQIPETTSTQPVAGPYRKYVMCVLKIGMVGACFGIVILILLLIIFAILGMGF